MMALSLRYWTLVLVNSLPPLGDFAKGWQGGRDEMSPGGSKFILR